MVVVVVAAVAAVAVAVAAAAAVVVVVGFGLKADGKLDKAEFGFRVSLIDGSGVEFGSRVLGSFGFRASGFAGPGATCHVVWT